MPAPLPIQDIFLKALIVPWRQRAALLRTLLLPSVGWVLLGYLARDWAPTSWVNALPMWVLWGVFYTFFAVTCHRLVLIGEDAVPRFGLMAFTKREGRFLLLLAAIYGLSVLAMLVGGTLFGSIFLNLLGDSEAVAQYATPLFSLISFVALGFMLARLGIVLPATAVGEKRDLRWAWQRSRGNTLRLFFVVGLIPYALSYLLTLINLGAGDVASILYRLIYFILLVIEIAALSLAYQALTADEDGDPVSR